MIAGRAYGSRGLQRGKTDCRRLALAVVLIISLACLMPVPKVVGETLELAGQFGGSCTAVAVSGTHVLTGIGAWLVVLDVSDPAHPVAQGKVKLPGWARGIAVEGGYAFVACESTSGLQVIDISNLGSPLLVGSYEASHSLSSVAVAGGYAYIGGEGSGLEVIDVSNPATPVRVGACDTRTSTLWPADPENVVVVGHYAYVVDYGLTVIDISNPAAPVRVGGCNGFSFYGLAVAGHYAYLPVNDRLHVLDVSDPAAPTPVAELAIGANCRVVTITGNYACLSGDNSGAVVVDISNPLAPVLLGSEATAMEARGIAAAGQYVYMADQYAGVQVIDIADPAVPARVGTYHTVGNMSDLAVKGNYAYVAETHGLAAIDISDPGDPTFKSECDVGGRATKVIVAGDHAYVLVPKSGMVVVDISDPGNPVRKGSYSIDQTAYDMAVAGGYVYLARGLNHGITDGLGATVRMYLGLDVIDVSNPTTPVFLRRAEYLTYFGYDIDVGYSSLNVAGPYAFWAVGAHGWTQDIHMSIEVFDVSEFRIFDVSNPADPRAGYEGVPWISDSQFGVVDDAAALGDYVYLSSALSQKYGLVVVNIAHQSNRLVPAVLGKYDTTSRVSGIKIAGNYAYLSVGDRVEVISLADPVVPSYVGRFEAAGFSSAAVAISGPWVYVAGGTYGFFVLRIGDQDGDGVLDNADGCPNDPSKTAPGVCGCGVPDVDSDGDGVIDCMDNCPDVANTDQADTDGDGVGDACQTPGGEGSPLGPMGPFCGLGVAQAAVAMLLGLGLLRVRGRRR